jgi:hypothetical protein
MARALASDLNYEQASLFRRAGRATDRMAHDPRVPDNKIPDNKVPDKEL